MWRMQLQSCRDGHAGAGRKLGLLKELTGQSQEQPQPGSLLPSNFFPGPPVEPVKWMPIQLLPRHKQVSRGLEPQDVVDAMVCCPLPLEDQGTASLSWQADASLPGGCSHLQGTAPPNMSSCWRHKASAHIFIWDNLEGPSQLQSSPWALLRPLSLCSVLLSFLKYSSVNPCVLIPQSRPASQELHLRPGRILTWKTEKLCSTPCFVTNLFCDLRQVPASLWAFNCKMRRFYLKLPFNWDCPWVRLKQELRASPQDLVSHE